MPSELQTPPKPVLDDATRSFVRRSLSAGLVELDDLKKVVMSLMAESDVFSPQRLADGLIGAGILTRWQANKLQAGKCKGFYLGSYRLLRPLGKGGMGIVYLGEHHVMKRLMALKILPPDAANDKRRIERFEAEARACAQLDHPNIVRAYDFARASERLYIVMEYVDGIDLHYAVQRDGQMSTVDALDVLMQAASGLAHAHERGIVHRDIKPSNLLLRTDGVVKVSDLGLARIGWSNPAEAEQKRLMGTADFVAPEQAIDSASVDSRADIYSLGCTLFFLLTGKAPFGGTAAQRLAKHQTAPVPNISSYRPDCPPAIAELLTRMTAKRPENRHKSAVELLAHLERIGGVGTEAPRSRLRHVSPAGDTAVDDSVYQATIDDTSLSADSDVVVVSEAEEFDFSELPPVASLADLTPASPIPLPRPAPTKPKQTNSSNGNGGAQGNQQLLLGVGLAVAVMALITVVGIGVVSFTKPAPVVTPKIKSVEDNDGHKVLIIRD